MIDEELLKKFDRIQDLPISEEMLGAYLEGNTSQSENVSIEAHLSDSSYLSSFVSGIDIDNQYVYDDFFEKNDDGMIDNSIDIFFNSEYENLENMKDLTRTYNTIGENGENLQDPVYIQQPDDHSCALRSQQIVLRDYGIDIPFEKLEELAKSYGVYTDQGTYTYDIGKVLQIAGVGMHQVQGSSFYDLTNELAHGHRVIVSVDANELWYNDSFTEKLKNWFDDTFKAQGGNHALIVAGVEVNPQNPDDVKVVLTDPGTGHLRIEYPLEQFMDAWKDSNCFMAATDNPAPYQYDAETGMEVPSNFAVQQYVNEFIVSHGYQLNPDMINIPQDYQPTFTGHLSMVGNLNYSEFEDNYQEYLDTRVPSALSIKEQIEEMAKSSMDSESHNKVYDEDNQEDENDDENGATVQDDWYDDGDTSDERDYDENDDNDDESNSEDSYDDETDDDENADVE